MIPETAVEKVLSEMRSQNLFPVLFTNIMRRYLYMIYSIGYNNGGRIKNEIPVIRYNQLGGDPKRYDSIVIASRMNEIDSTTIVKVCKGKWHTAGGYIWRYESDTLSAKQ